MKFFTAGDVLEHARGPPTEPITVNRDNTVSEALKVMLRNDFDQLPVKTGEEVVGAVTFKSVGRLATAVPDAHLESTSVMGALVEPTYVSVDHDMFELFETFAVEEFVLVGSEEQLQGIITRYDVFHFLKEQFRPFIMIGEIEQSLRALFEREFPDIDSRIQETLGARAEHDPSYSVPDSLDYFNFEEYKRFIASNFEELSTEIQHNREFILQLLEGVRKNRNALLHFRAGVNEIDREILEVAHGYFTNLVE
jgi:CBS domain-containing protein